MKTLQIISADGWYAKFNWGGEGISYRALICWALIETEEDGANITDIMGMITIDGCIEPADTGDGEFIEYLTAMQLGEERGKAAAN